MICDWRHGWCEFLQPHSVGEELGLCVEELDWEQGGKRDAIVRCWLPAPSTNKTLYRTLLLTLKQLCVFVFVCVSVLRFKNKVNHIFLLLLFSFWGFIISLMLLNSLSFLTVFSCVFWVYDKDIYCHKLRTFCCLKYILNIRMLVTSLQLSKGKSAFLYLRNCRSLQ